MPSFAEVLLPLALILPFAGSGMATGERDPEPDLFVARSHSPVPRAAYGEQAVNSRPAARADEPLPPEPLRPDGMSASPGSLSVLLEGLVVRQVRVRQRTYIRITPRSVSRRRDMVAQLPVRPEASRYREQAPRRCIPVDQIAGVETGSGNRLLLFLEDAKVMSLNLEKACRARDFYSGFYVERNKDGKLCVERDTLQSRNGARCDIDRMMQLVSATD